MVASKLILLLLLCIKNKLAKQGSSKQGLNRFLSNFLLHWFRCLMEIFASFSRRIITLNTLSDDTQYITDQTTFLVILSHSDSEQPKYIKKSIACEIDCTACHIFVPTYSKLIQMNCVISENCENSSIAVNQLN